MVTETKRPPSTAKAEDARFVEACLDECWKLFKAEANPENPADAEKLLKDHFRPFFTRQLRVDPHGVWGRWRNFVMTGTRKLARLSVAHARKNGRTRPNRADIEHAIREIPVTACPAPGSETTGDDVVRIEGGWCTEPPEAK